MNEDEANQFFYMTVNYREREEKPFTPSSSSNFNRRFPDLNKCLDNVIDKIDWFYTCISLQPRREVTPDPDKIIYFLTKSEAQYFSKELENRFIFCKVYGNI